HALRIVGEVQEAVAVVVDPVVALPRSRLALAGVGRGAAAGILVLAHRRHEVHVAVAVIVDPVGAVGAPVRVELARVGLRDAAGVGGVVGEAVAVVVLAVGARRVGLVLVLGAAAAGVLSVVHVAVAVVVEE